MNDKSAHPLHDLSLFLGFALDADCENSLLTIEPRMLQLYISDSDESYLKEVLFEKKKYIGKFVGSIVELNEVVALEKNILSILNKFLPPSLILRTSLSLFTIQPPKLDDATRSK